MISVLLAATEVKQSGTVIAVALIAAAAAVFGPLVGIVYLERRRERERVAEKKAEATREAERKAERLAVFERTEAVRKMAEEAALLLRSNNAAVAASAADTHARLEVIHGLVNSSLTAALQGQYDALKELVEWKDDEQRPVSTSTRATLRELETILAERKVLGDGATG